MTDQPMNRPTLTRRDFVARTALKGAGLAALTDSLLMNTKSARAETLTSTSTHEHETLMPMTSKRNIKKTVKIFRNYCQTFGH